MKRKVIKNFSSSCRNLVKIVMILEHSSTWLLRISLHPTVWIFWSIVEAESTWECVASLLQTAFVSHRHISCRTEIIFRIKSSSWDFARTRRAVNSMRRSAFNKFPVLLFFSRLLKFYYCFMLMACFPLRPALMFTESRIREKVF